MRDVGSIVDGPDLQITTSAHAMSDHSSTVDDVDCLGTLYGAEEPVYAGSGWTAVRDQVIREPRSDNRHWVEQTAVLFGSAARASGFFTASRAVWKTCANTSVTTTEGSYSARVWKLANVGELGRTGRVVGEVGEAGGAGEAMITQDSEQQDANGWACQHAMGVVANLVSEAFACGYSVSDEAQRIVARILTKAADR
ncbi:MAG: sensor domain-containing protein [Mycobacteriaceae bacterium]|nr:sensor domain-containing protein [Mycobacteriaceae bacterium]MBV9641588.1 sensor domain-containing protein [Mycobacteriaceae bacterium]